MNFVGQNKYDKSRISNSNMTKIVWNNLLKSLIFNKNLVLLFIVIYTISAVKARKESLDFIVSHDIAFCHISLNLASVKWK